MPDISKWNLNKVIDISRMFSYCSSLTSLPDISKWNTNNFKHISGIFINCSSLESLPDISKWNANNVVDMNSLFVNCSLLFFYQIYLTGILKMLIIWIGCLLIVVH